MSKISLQFSQIRSEVENLRTANSKFKETVTALSDSENRLNGMWDGAANDSFHEAFAKDKIQMDNFYNAVEKYVSVLEQIAERYERAENSNVEIAKAREY